MEQPPKEPQKEENTGPFSPEEINQARNQILAILQNIEREGAVDSERDEIRNILSGMEHGKLEPKMAVEKALNILEQRQNYH